MYKHIYISICNILFTMSLYSRLKKMRIIQTERLIREIFQKQELQVLTTEQRNNLSQFLQYEHGLSEKNANNTIDLALSRIDAQPLIQKEEAQKEAQNFFNKLKQAKTD